MTLTDNKADGKDDLREQVSWSYDPEEDQDGDGIEDGPWPENP